MTDAVLLAGDRYHQPEDAFAGVGPALEAAGLAPLCTTDYAALDADLLRGQRLLCILRDGMLWPNGHDQPSERWMQPHQEEAIESFVLNGGAFLALHNAGWDYPWQGGYRRTLAGYYQGHPPIAPFKVSVFDRDHPITQGVEEYEIVDEQHFLWFDLDRVRLLLKSQGQNGMESAAGWAYTYGRGRVAYLANGHTLEILQHPMVQRLLHNAARWLVERALR
jgi:type 1 glutamine amidotransferase